ncbi:MAG: ATP-grasp domain-containing protein [Planctomycetota bacterium]|nr:MAG: ATP-grasp domain-containing protein [Planctomycetota bacterium]
MSLTSQKLRRISDPKTARSVLLCGASVRSLAESAIAAGLRPLCVDFFKDADLDGLLESGRGRFVGRINNFTELPAMVRSVRSTIPMLWAGGLENHTDLLREIGLHRPLIGTAPDIADQLRDPWILNNWLAKAKIGVPRLATQPTADADCHWLQKSVASSGGLGIGLYNSDSSETATHMSHGRYLQEYIDGVPMSALLCADHAGVHLVGMSLQLIGWPSLGASGFLFCGNVGPVDPGEQVTQQVLEAAKILVERSGIHGVFGIDFILRQSHAWFLEVNPRVTASHMLYELQQPGLVIHRHLAALGWKSGNPRRSLLKHASRPLRALSPVAARLILWAREDIHVPEGFGNEPRSAVQIADRPHAGTVVPRSNPFCSILLTATDCDEIIQKLELLTDPSSANPNSSLRTLQTRGYSTRIIACQLKLLWQKYIQSTSRPEQGF